MAFNPATGFTVGFGNQNPRQRTIADESTKFPGITKADETKIMNIARSQAHSEYEENLIANDLYKEALKNQNSKNYVSNRQDAKQELSYKSSTTKDKKQSNKLRTTERTAEVADMIRNYAKANGYGNTLEGWEDVDVINGFANDNKQVRQEVEDYINGEESSFSFSKRMGFGAGSERSRFDMITEDKGEWNDDILGHFETESLDDAKGNKVGTWFKNLGKSAYNLASDLTNMVMNPVDTVNNLSKAAVGGAMNLLGSDDYIGNMKDGKVKDRFESANTVADGMGDFLKNRYGGVDQIANSLYQDPVGVISDIASVVTGGAGLVKGAAKATAKTALKAGAKNTVKNASKVANVADDIMKAGIKYDPATQIMNAEGKVLKGAYKGTKATVNTVAHPIESIKGAYRTVAEGLNKVSDWGAEKITKTATAQDKLYKAQEPRMNSLTRNKDLEKRRVNSDRANQLIVENGYKPTDTNSRLLAHEATMKKIWNEVEGRINGGEPVQIDQSRLAEALYDYIREQKDLGSSFNEADLAALEREVKTLEGKNVDLPTLEKKKQLYNSIVNNRGEQKVSDVFANGIKKLTHEIGVIEDEILAEIPGDFQKLKNDFGAMADTYEDVFKADMKNQRKKGMGLTETYSRIEGAGDMLNGALSIFNGGAKDIIKGAGKVLIGKSLAKAKDVDFLVKQGFEELTNGYKTAKSKVGDTLDQYKWRSNPEELQAAQKEFVDTYEKASNMGGNYSPEYLESMKPKYNAAKAEYDPFIQKMADDIGGTPLKAPLKFDTGEGYARTLAKGMDRGGIDNVTDIVRGTVAVEDEAGMLRAKDWIEKWAKENNLSLDDISFDDKFTTPTPMGYKDISFIYTTKNGVKAEVQINIPEMMVAKEGENAIKMGIVDKAQYDAIVKKAGVEGGNGHILYEKWRKLNDKWKETGDKSIKAQMDKLVDESLDYYAKFFK